MSRMTTALLVIDVQDSFRRLPSWEQISNPGIAAVAGRLVEHARNAGESVVWVLHGEPGSGDVFDPESGFVALQPGLSPAPGEPVVTKSSHNAFTTTALQQYLVTNQVDTVRVCGIRTEQCVETTARVASDLGYTVEFVVDATATHPLPLYDGSGMLSADEVIARTAAALTDRFATIRTVAEVLADPVG